MKCTILTILMCVGTLSAQGEEHRPFSEMKGGCDNFAMDLKQELKLWEAPATTVDASQSGKDLATVSIGSKVSLGLSPQSSVKLIASPEKSFPVEKAAFSGLGQIVIPVSGVYRFALGKKLWLDVVDVETTRPVSAKKFEMQTSCAKIFKAIEFDLAAGKKYALQISSSSERDADVLITSVGHQSQK